MAEQKKNYNNYVVIMVAIVAIVAIIVMVSGARNKTVNLSAGDDSILSGQALAGNTNTPIGMQPTGGRSGCTTTVQIDQAWIDSKPLHQVTVLSGPTCYEFVAPILEIGSRDFKLTNGAKLFGMTQKTKLYAHAEDRPSDYGVIHVAEGSSVENVIVEYPDDNGGSGPLGERHNHHLTGFYVSGTSSIKNCAVIGYKFMDQDLVLSPGVITKDTATANGVTVSYMRRGFVMYGSSSVTASTASGNIDEGFLIEDTATATGCTSFGNAGRGFVLVDDANVVNSFSRMNEQGFYLSGTSNAVNCNASHNNMSSPGNNNYGYKLEGSATVTGSTAYKNKGRGYELYGSSSVANSSAIRNGQLGFYMKGNSHADQCNSDHNIWGGFELFDSSYTYYSSVYTSYGNGFYLHGSSHAEGGTSKYNRDSGYCGYKLEDSSFVHIVGAYYNSVGICLYDNSYASQATASDSNAEGFILYDTSHIIGATAKFNAAKGIWVQNNAYVQGPTTSCWNYNQTDFLSSTYGQSTGTITADSIICGGPVGCGQATFVDCPVPVCTDSDGGKVYNTHGSVSVNGEVKRGDWCPSTTVLEEAFCQGNLDRKEQVTCASKIPGSTCVGGKCVTASSCTDTDGGDVKTVKGTAYGTYNGQSFSKTDSCNYGNSGYILTEYYCSGGNYASKTYNCRCVDGKCTN